MFVIKIILILNSIVWCDWICVWAVTRIQNNKSYCTFPTVVQKIFFWFDFSFRDTSAGWIFADTVGLYPCPVFEGQSVWPPGHQQPHQHQQDDRTQAESDPSPPRLSITARTVPLHKPHNSFDLWPSCDTVEFGREPTQLQLWLRPQKTRRHTLRISLRSPVTGDANVSEKTCKAMKATDSEINLTSLKRSLLSQHREEWRITAERKVSLSTIFLSLHHLLPLFASFLSFSVRQPWHEVFILYVK